MRSPEPGQPAVPFRLGKSGQKSTLFLPWYGAAEEIREEKDLERRHRMNLIPRKENQLSAMLPSLWDTDFDTLFNRFPWHIVEEGIPESPFLTPAVDMSEDEKEFIVRAELPGVDPQNLHVSIEEGALVLSGEKSEEKKKTEGGFTRTECRYGSFYRLIPLPETIQEKGVTAEVDNGVVTIRIPRKEAEKPHRIPVKKKK